MALYYFHLRDGQDVLLDPEGVELPSPDAIEARALLSARSLLSADALDGRLRFDFHIDVEDAAGEIVHHLAFEDAVEIVPPAAKAER